MRRWWLAGLAGAALVAAGLTALVQKQGSPPPAVADATAPATADAKGDGPLRQGIAIKGHWQIEVRNPDGTVAQRREFDNAFVGAHILSHMLSGEAAGVHSWLVELESYSATCSNAYCDIRQIAAVGQTPAGDGELGVTFINNIVNEARGIRLTGRIGILTSGAITCVHTGIYQCVATASRQSCAPSDQGTAEADPWNFTTHCFGDSDIPVLAGQVVLVTIDIVFA